MITVGGRLVGFCSLSSALLLWPASWLPAIDKSRGSKSVEVQRVWEVYDERLRFMSRRDASLLDESLDRDDVSLACLFGLGLLRLHLLMLIGLVVDPCHTSCLVLGRG